MFRTELPIAPATDQLPRTAQVLTVGSCFADSIGSRLAAHKVDTLVNPFGTVFQPLALGRLLRAAAGEDVDWQQHLVEARGRWQSYDLHGSIGADSPVELLQTIQELVRRTGEFLRGTDVVLLTLGTAWAYRLRETGELVNNCHKQPADLFVRELLTPDEIINGLAETHAYLRRLNPALRFVLTVSPVRHLNDTLPLNSVSKSVLRVATHFVSDLLPGVAYFPAYELLVDDLRDYRFYAADMLHPSEVAEDYVWDKFARTYFDAEFGRFRKEWAAVRQSLGHRPLHAAAPEHRQFLENTLEKLEQLSLRKVGVATELQAVRTQLAALPLPRQTAPAVVADDDEERIDIGESPVPTTASASAPPAETAPVPTTERPPRLSPEEFRAQRTARQGRPERGRRDGRGKGNRDFASEDEQFQTAGAATADEDGALSESTPASAPQAFIAPLQSVFTAEIPTSPGVVTDAVEDDSAKKKKRRSRGGAKRTARKNALRLAAEGISPEAGPASAVGVDGEPDASVPNQPAALPGGKKSTVIVKSTPIKRGGRRNEPSRVPRTELFADSPMPAVSELATGAGVSPLIETLAAASVPAGPTATASPDAAANLANTRDNRNRNNRKARPDAGVTASDEATAPRSNEPLSGVRVGRTEPSSSAVEPGAPAPEGLNQGLAPLTTAAPAVGREAAAPEAVPAPVAARRPNRAKRVASGARTEKPAVDTPVVPVPDALLARTQVAAGRMTGSSATLVEPVAPSAKAGEPHKAATTKAAAGKARAAAPAAAASAFAPAAPAAVKAKPTAKPRAAVKAELVPTRPAKPKPVAKTKAGTAKPAVPKPPAAKAPAKVVAKNLAKKPASAKPKLPKEPGSPA